MEVRGNPDGKHRIGAFEVTTDDGRLLWSKLGADKVPGKGVKEPSTDDIARIIEALRD
eukprot:CAMPEP_0184656600 /NCGR_PEP_ID=MMETSP0308-20130426/16619_1 /TAXON_ID=38269 /ORGANISM="Gloeochaete witrockiana, Strain SAG 46.84" /LENGTH=57 /DNA_ID=CAMNT_0027093793 /DNA_START=175 /DNA_END=348 /DNA_ORIENTATION=+